MNVNVLEIRNYLIQPTMRDHFIDNFDAHFTDPLEVLDIPVLGQFRQIGEPDHYVWLRGFSDMSSRKEGLTSFYSGPIWRKYGKFTNSMLIDSDNVHLLRPLTPTDLTCGLTSESIFTQFEDAALSPNTGIVAIDFYQAKSGKRDAMIAAFQQHILPAYQQAGVDLRGLFVAEMSENTYPRLPAVQNPDELVVFTVYENEAACHEKRDALEQPIHKAIGKLLTITPETLLLHPTLRSAMRYTGA